jgi:IS30 family transposase
MSGHGEKMTRKEEAAIAALLMHPTIGEAAKACGVAESTLWRWLRRGDFQARYRDARAEAVSQAIARLQQISSKAVTTLECVMDAEDSSDTAKVQAAKIVLEMAIKGTELAELQRRLTELEHGQNPDTTPEDEHEEAAIVS